MAQAPQKTGGGGGALYYEIANFQTGMDLRKSPLTAPAGTLRLLKNAHITPGGEIEKREAFVYWCNAPAGSIGLCTDNSGRVYTHLASGTPGQIDPPTASAVGVIHIAAPVRSIKLTATIEPTSTWNVTSMSGGSIGIGTLVTGPDVAGGTVVVAYGTGGGGTGTYLVTPAQTAINSTGATDQIKLTGYIVGTVLTVTAAPLGGSIGIGTIVTGPGVTAGTTITSLGTGVGSTGTYNVNNAQSAYPTGAINSFPAVGLISGSTPTMNVSAISGGALVVGSKIYGTGVAAGTVITDQGPAALAPIPSARPRPASRAAPRAAR
jgi:hypothetical protein